MSDHGEVTDDLNVHGFQTENGVMPKEVPMDLDVGLDQADQDQGAQQQAPPQNNPPTAEDQGAQGITPPGTPVIPVPQNLHRGGLGSGQQPPPAVPTTPQQQPARADGIDEQQAAAAAANVPRTGAQGDQVPPPVVDA